MTSHRLILTLGALAASSTLALADHGRDFLIVEDTHVPAPGNGQALLNFEWERTSGENEFGLEPGFTFGVLPQLAIGVQASFRDEADEGWDYSAVRPNLHFVLTPDSWKLPFRASISAAYQFASGDADAAESDDHHEEAHDDHGHEHEHEHAVEADTHSHAVSGVHNHTDDLFTFRLNLETNLTDSTRLAGNLIGVFPDGSSATWGYAAGIRQTLTEQVGVGIEALGDFESDGWQELSGAIYLEPVSNFLVKIGAGFGLNDSSPDFILRAGLNWKF